MFRVYALFLNVDAYSLDEITSDERHHVRKLERVRLFCSGELLCKFDHLILRSRGLGAGSGSGITPWA